MPDTLLKKNNRCYAAEMGNCSTVISGEHFISREVLSSISKDRMIELSGFSWLGNGKKKQVPFDSLKSNILCVHHNGLLSPYDAEAAKLFRYLRICKEYLEGGKIGEDSYSIDGSMIEKWAIKVMCGLLVSGNIVALGRTHKHVKIKREALDLLYRSTELSDRCGLYMVETDAENKTNNTFTASPFSARLGPRIDGIIFCVYGINFIVSMATPDLEHNRFIKSIIYHPKRITFFNSGRNMNIVLMWRCPGEEIVEIHPNANK